MIDVCLCNSFHQTFRNLSGIFIGQFFIKLPLGYMELGNFLKTKSRISFIIPTLFWYCRHQDYSYWTRTQPMQHLTVSVMVILCKIQTNVHFTPRNNPYEVTVFHVSFNTC